MQTTISSIGRFFSAMASSIFGSVRHKPGTEAKRKKRSLNLKICSRKKLKLPVERTEAQVAEARELMTQLADIRHKEADLICPICLKFLCYASCAPCGHSFCEVCLAEYQLLCSDCLVCGFKVRTKKHSAIPAKNLDNLVEK